jgi:hypothetical protein
MKTKPKMSSRKRLSLFKKEFHELLRKHQIKIAEGEQEFGLPRVYFTTEKFGDSLDINEGLNP